MTIYAVESGEYSDYRVDALFSTHKNAKFYQKACGGWIVERELDPDISQYRKGLHMHRVIMNRNGRCRDVCDVDEIKPDVSNFEVADEWLFYMWAKNQKHAVKIANERRTQLLATEKWKL